ncbi:hypothetical protein [Paraurantiacibacter namhicola]|uniref:Uncharacterized protein n=1 Tax=Paraurantiacibacter namhicola TaxID=645517 RepID=A0A1C7D640_9SPHN|nr:hypothetical protein [Paraurantiacibacter namhicola]ANU06924.1 hypothetical protein A6F65_00602 [Paraurantiacibacter namhicola]
MATLAADTVKQQSRAKGGKPPISAHPAFPAVVALWFAALFGLGCMVLPIALLESFVTATGISSFFAAAQPPLGMTARLSMALGFAAIGAGFGYWLGNKVADAQAPKPEGRALFGEIAGGGTSAPTPISARDELGEEGLGGEQPAGQKQKRRSLAIEEDEGPSDYMTYVPVPGEGEGSPVHEPVDIDALELGDFASEEGEPDDPEPVHLEHLRNDTAEVGEDGEDAAEPADEADSAASPPLQFSAPSLASERQLFQPDMPAPEPDSEPITDLISDPAIKQTYEPAPEPAKTLAFSAPSQAEMPAQPASFEMPHDHAAEPLAATPPIHAERPAMPSEFTPEDQPQLHAAPVQQPAAPQQSGSEPGLMALAERLGGAIRKRQEMAAAAPQPAFAPQAAPAGLDARGAVPALAAEEIDPLQDDDVASAVASFFKKPEAAAPADFSAPSPATEPAAQSAMPQAFAAPQQPPEQAPEPAEPMEQVAEAQPAFAAEPTPVAPPAPSNPFARMDLSVHDDDDEDDDSDDLAASLTLPLNAMRADPSQPRQVFQAPQAVDAHEDEAHDDEAGEDVADESTDRFGSLSEMSNPFARKQEFVRVDEPEDDGVQQSVSFPPQAAVDGKPSEAASAAPRPFDPPAGMAAAEAPADREKAERELREALETLQRISGAA